MSLAVSCSIPEGEASCLDIAYLSSRPVPLIAVPGLVREQVAFARFYKKYFPLVNTWLGQMCREHADIFADLAQDIFLKLWVNRDQLQPLDLSDAYLYVMARNHLFNYLRKQLVRRRFSESPTWQPTEVMPVDEHFLGKQLGLQVEAMIRRFPPRMQAAWLMRMELGMNYEKISTVMEISPSTAKNLYMSAQRRLRKKLTSENP